MSSLFHSIASHCSRYIDSIQKRESRGSGVEYGGLDGPHRQPVRQQLLQRAQTPLLRGRQQDKQRSHCRNLQMNVVIKFI